jgi:hypothetical protein
MICTSLPQNQINYGSIPLQSLTEFPESQVCGKFDSLTAEVAANPVLQECLSYKRYKA